MNLVFKALADNAKDDGQTTSVQIYLFQNQFIVFRENHYFGSQIFYEVKVDIERNGSKETLVAKTDDDKSEDFFVFSIDESQRESLLNTGATLTFFKHKEVSAGYILVTDRSYLPEISETKYETLTEDIRQNYKPSGKTRTITTSEQFSDINSENYTEIYDFSVAETSSPRRTALDKLRQTMNIQVLAPTAFIGKDDLSKNVVSGFPVEVSGKAIGEWIEKRIEDAHRDERQLEGSYFKAPYLGEQVLIQYHSWHEELTANYYAKPYTPEYKTELLRKRNGGYYADGRSRQVLAKPEPINTIQFSLQTLFAENALAMSQYLESLYSKLTLKE